MNLDLGLKTQMGQQRKKQSSLMSLIILKVNQWFLLKSKFGMQLKINMLDLFLRVENLQYLRVSQIWMDLKKQELYMLDLFLRVENLQYLRVSQSWMDLKKQELYFSLEILIIKCFLLQN